MNWGEEKTKSTPISNFSNLHHILQSRNFHTPSALLHLKEMNKIQFRQTLWSMQCRMFFLFFSALPAGCHQSLEAKPSSTWHVCHGSPIWVHKHRLVNVQRAQQAETVCFQCDFDLRFNKTSTLHNSCPQMAPHNINQNEFNAKEAVCILILNYLKYEQWQHFERLWSLRLIPITMIQYEFYLI